MLWSDFRSTSSHSELQLARGSTAHDSFCCLVLPVLFRLWKKSDKLACIACRAATDCLQQPKGQTQMANVSALKQNAAMAHCADQYRSNPTSFRQKTCSRAPVDKEPRLCTGRTTMPGHKRRASQNTHAIFFFAAQGPSTLQWTVQDRWSNSLQLPRPFPRPRFQKSSESGQWQRVKASITQASC